MHPTQVVDWLARHRLEAWMAARMSAAGLIGFAITQFLHVAQVAWVVLTAVIVTQGSIGSSLKAIIDRLIGTIGGAAWGVAVATAIPQINVVSTGLTLVISLVPLAAIVAFRPSYRMAPVTAVIVLLGYGGQGGVVEAGLNRVLEIGLGSAVALAVILFVSPARALDLLRTAGRDALAAMADQVKTLLGGITVAIDTAAVMALHDGIRAAIERASAVADEADRERRSYLSEAPDPEPLVRTMRRLSHDLVIVARALALPLPEAVAGRLAQPAASLAASLEAALDGLGTALASRSPPSDLAAAEQALASFEDEMAAMRRDGVTRELPADVAERVFGLSFGLDQLGRNLVELAGRIRELEER